MHTPWGTHVLFAVSLPNIRWVEQEKHKSDLLTEMEISIRISFFFLFFTMKIIIHRPFTIYNPIFLKINIFKLSFYK